MVFSKILYGKVVNSALFEKNQIFAQRPSSREILPKRFFDCILIFFFKNPKIEDFGKIWFLWISIK